MANGKNYVHLVYLCLLIWDLCSSEQLYPLEQDLQDDDFRSRYKREMKAMQQMSSININNGEITARSIDDIVAGVIKQAELKNPIVLRSWRVNPPPTDHRSVSVDSTVVTMLMEVHSKGVSPKFRIYDPSGTVVSPTDDRNITLEVNSNRLKIMKINNPIPGDWLIRFQQSKQEYNVTIRGSSVVNFRCTFLNGWGIPLSGRPVTGSNVTLRIDLLGSEHIRKLSEVMLTTLAGTIIQTKQLGKPTGRRQRTYRVAIWIPGEDFRVAVRGLDMLDKTVERTLINPVVPDGIKLSLKSLTPGVVQTGGNYTLQYTVYNDDRWGGNFTITALSDTPSLEFFVRPHLVYTPAGHRARGTVTVHVSAHAVPGTKSDIVIRATNTSGDFQVSSREISVVGDTRPPAFFATHVIDNCATAQASTWQVIFQVQDDESGIHKVDVDDHTVSSITMETFDDGQANIPVTGYLRIQCTSKQVTVIVDDVEGNEGRFVVSHERVQLTTPAIQANHVTSPHLTAILTGILAGILLIIILVTIGIQCNMNVRDRRKAAADSNVSLTSRKGDMQVYVMGDTVKRHSLS